MDGSRIKRPSRRDKLLEGSASLASSPAMVALIHHRTLFNFDTMTHHVGHWIVFVLAGVSVLGGMAYTADGDNRKGRIPPKPISQKTSIVRGKGSGSRALVAGDDASAASTLEADVFSRQTKT